MAQQRTMNKWLLAIVMASVLLLTLLMCSDSRQRYQAMDTLPTLDQHSQPQDGDTQADTIKALQAYAKAAVEKAQQLQQSTQAQLGPVTDNQQRIQALQQRDNTLEDDLLSTQQRIQSLETQLSTLKRQWRDNKTPAISAGTSTPAGIPNGLGFDVITTSEQSLDTTQGRWHEPIDQAVAGDTHHKNNTRFTGLLSTTSLNTGTTQGKKHNTENRSPNGTDKNNTATVRPVYTIPKDATVTDAVALTALIGRIPVNGQTPDPYPVKLFVGRDTLLANGHDLPDIAGMMFSGLGIGDWNLSCVSARLYSASYIFPDGRIVNHSSSAEPLAYISDPTGIPCVAGQFVSNAPAFLAQRAGLAGLGVAGAAYAEAQQQTHTSALTGNTTRQLMGDIDKLVAGQVVKSATDDVSQWLLERQKQSFDAVVVAPGTRVAIHLNQALALDQHPLLRKVRYGDNNDPIHSVMD